MLSFSRSSYFATDAKWGKSSMGWFFGFKLHLAVNDQGKLLACCLTSGNVDDRQPVLSMVKKLRGQLFRDRDYIFAPLTQLLIEQGLHLITRLRKSMKNRLIHLSDKLLLRKRAIIEAIIDQLKNISEIRAFAPSQSYQFCGSFGCWVYCLQPSRQKTRPPFQSTRSPGCLIGLT